MIDSWKENIRYNNKISTLLFYKKGIKGNAVNPFKFFLIVL